MSNLTKSIETFFKKDSAPGILLMIATISALIVANTPLNHFYHTVMQLKFEMGFENVYMMLEEACDIIASKLMET